MNTPKRLIAGIAATSVLMTGMTLPASAAAYDTDPVWDAEIFSLVNTTRANYEGVEPLQIWEPLNDTALEWASFLADDPGVPAHPPAEQIAADTWSAGCVGFASQEILTHPEDGGNPNFTPEEALLRYQQSHLHNVAMLNPIFKYAGVATVHGPQGTYNVIRLATDCGDNSPFVESTFEGVSAQWMNANQVRFSGWLNASPDGGSKTVSLYTPDGFGKEITANSDVDPSKYWVDDFISAPSESGNYYLTYAGQPGLDSAASQVLEFKLETSLTGLETHYSAPAMSSTGHALGTVQVSPAFGRSAQLQELVDGEWVNVGSAQTVVGQQTGEFTLTAPGRSVLDETFTFRVHVPASGSMPEVTSDAFTVHYSAPPTVVDGFEDYLSQYYGDGDATISFWMDTENGEWHERTVRVTDLDTNESTDYTFESPGQVDINLGSLPVGTHNYRVTIQGNEHGAAWTSDFTVDVDPFRPVLSGIEPYQEVAVGEQLDIPVRVTVREQTEVIWQHRPVGTSDWTVADEFVLDPGTHNFDVSITPNTWVENGVELMLTTVATANQQSNAITGALNIRRLDPEVYIIGSTYREAKWGETLTPVTVQVPNADSITLVNNLTEEETVVPVNDGLATISLPDGLEAGTHFFTLRVDGTPTHEPWSELLTVEILKHDTEIEGWVTDEQLFEEGEEKFIEVQATPSADGSARELILESSLDGLDWEQSATASADSQGRATFRIASGEVGDNVYYRVVATETVSNLFAETLPMLVRTLAFPTEVLDAPEGFNAMVEDDPINFCVQVSPANGRTMRLEKQGVDGWTEIQSVLMEDEEIGEACFVIADVLDVAGTHTYRLAVGAGYHAESYVSDPFDVVVNKHEDIEHEIDDLSVAVGDLITTQIPVMGEGRELIVRLVSDDAFDLYTFDQKEGEDFIQIRIPTGSDGKPWLAVGSTATWEAILVENYKYAGTTFATFDSTVSAIESVVEATPGGEFTAYMTDPIDDRQFVYVSNDIERQWIWQRYDEATGEWESQYSHDNIAATGFSLFSSSPGTRLFRIHAPATETHTAWTSEVYTLITLRAEHPAPEIADQTDYVAADEARNLTVPVEYSYGHTATLQQLLSGEWVDVGTFTQDVGEVHIVIPLSLSTAGSFTYRVRLNQTLIYEEAYSNVFTHDVVKYETSMDLTSDPENLVFNAGWASPFTLIGNVDGEAPRTVVLERLVDDGADSEGFSVMALTWETVSTTLADSNGDFTFVTDAPLTAGTYEYRVRALETPTEQEQSFEFTVEVMLNDPVVIGSLPVETVVTIGETVSPGSLLAVDTYTWVTERQLDDGSWEEIARQHSNVHTVAPDVSSVGSQTYRVRILEDGVYNEWVSNEWTVTVRGLAPTLTGWTGGDVEIEEGEATVPQLVTSDVDFTLQRLVDGTWTEVATYAAGADIEVDIPAETGSYRLFAAANGNFEEFISDVLNVSVLAAEPVDPQDPSDPAEDPTQGVDEDDSRDPSRNDSRDDRADRDGDRSDRADRSGERAERDRLESTGVELILIGLVALGLLFAGGAIFAIHRRATGS